MEAIARIIHAYVNVNWFAAREKGFTALASDRLPLLNGSHPFLGMKISIL